ncbi:MAG: hypothetical protein PHH31_07650 [Acidaminococcaceae bacterium]|nr:hypothetical protein [Acidaminococcaceae bacterium]
MRAHAKVLLKDLLVLVILLFSFMQTAFAGTFQVEAAFPYNLEQKKIDTVYDGSTNPLYLSIESVNYSEEQNAKITLVLPRGLQVATNEAKWQQTNLGTSTMVTSVWKLDAHYTQKFDLLPLQATTLLPEGKNIIKIIVEIGPDKSEQVLHFTHSLETMSNIVKGKNITKKEYNWYINKLTLPVDNKGIRDEKVSEGSIYVRDTEFESFRNRMIGDGATNWAAIYNHPATYLLLELSNPKRDTKVLKFKAELQDKVTGEIVSGLCTANQTEDIENQGWSTITPQNDATTALLALTGSKNQTFVLPIYVDTTKVTAGEYNLRVTVYSNDEKKISEIPLEIVKKSNIGLFSIGFSFFCFLVFCFALGKIRKTIINIGAKGSITVALFAAIAFGSIVIPTTLGGDFLRIFLGPFSGLVTGLLNGTLLYLLMFALLMLYRKPGIVALLFIIKWLLAGVMFGRFTPLGLLSYAVYIVVIEGILYFSGFYFKQELSKPYLFFIALLMGIADAFVTFITMEQMMFFYRLYYAGWYIILYMLVNGLLYSSIGCLMGFKVGKRLQQVMGE